MRIKLDEGAFMPIRAHKTDAGLDLRAKDRKMVRAFSSAVFNTGVHIALPIGHCGVILPKSGLNIKHDITTSGLIDEGYTGEIVVKLINFGMADYQIEAGDKIAQLVIIPCVTDLLEVVDDLGVESERGANGFGSSGR